MNNFFKFNLSRVLLMFLLVATTIKPYTGWTQITIPYIITPKTQPLTALQALQAINSTASASSQPTYSFNLDTKTEISQFCPFLVQYQNVPQIPSPSDVPTDTIENLQNFVTSFNNTIRTISTFITNYSADVKKWSTSNALTDFSALLTTMNTNNSNYSAAQKAHTTCVSSAPASSTIQAGCNTELMNYITATNALYDSFAAVLNVLNSYNLAPSWANPVVRVQTAATAPDSQGKNIAFVYNGQTIQINNIKGFDSASFVQQINICIAYLQNQLQSCYNFINQINALFNTINSNITATSDAIKSTATTLQQQNQGLNSQVANIEKDVGEGLNIFLNVAPSVKATGAASIAAGEFVPVADLEMPAFTAFTLLLNELADLSGANNLPIGQFMSSLSAQMNQGMIDNWSAIDWKSSGDWENGGNEWDLTKALGYTIGTLAIGAVTPITTTLNLIIVSKLIDSVANVVEGNNNAEESITQVANPYSIAGGL